MSSSSQEAIRNKGWPRLSGWNVPLTVYYMNFTSVPGSVGDGFRQAFFGTVKYKCQDQLERKNKSLRIVTICSLRVR